MPVKRYNKIGNKKRHCKNLRYRLIVRQAVMASVYFMQEEKLTDAIEEQDELTLIVNNDS